MNFRRHSFHFTIILSHSLQAMWFETYGIVSVAPTRWYRHSKHNMNFRHHFPCMTELIRIGRSKASIHKDFWNPLRIWKIWRFIGQFYHWYNFLVTNSCFVVENRILFFKKSILQIVRCRVEHMHIFYSYLLIFLKFGYVWYLMLIYSNFCANNIGTIKYS